MTDNNLDIRTYLWVSPKPGSFRKTAMSTATLNISEGFPLFNPAHPSENCFWMGVSENRNAPVVNAPHAQGGNGGALPSPFFYKQTFRYR